MESMIVNGVSKELAEFRYQQISNLNYELHFILPSDKSKTIDATALITFSLENNDNPIILDFKVETPIVKNIIINNKQVNITVEKEHLVVPKEYLTEGANKLSFQFVAGNQSLNRKENYLYTLLVPDRARTLFPCFDQPDLKATYELSLDIPENWKAIAGEYGKTTLQNNRKLIQFKKSKKISTYLFSFVAGEFKEEIYNKDGFEFHMLHMEEADKMAQNIDKIFDLHVKSVQWISNYTGIPLPFNKLDFALIPPFQYGGMEHVGAIQYRASSLILDENADDSQKMRRAKLIAHEVAHMWFGNLVTMKWFDDVWLKEVFANFIAAKAVAPEYPNIDHQLQFYLAHQDRAYVVDRTSGSHPIQLHLENLNMAGTLYGAIIYSKAPVVMAQLELNVGEDVLQKGLQNYLKKYAYSNATFDDLIQEISISSGKDLSKWADSWVKEAGQPKIFHSRLNTDSLKISYNSPYKSQMIEIDQREIFLNMRDTVIELSKNKFPLDQSGKGYGYFIIDEEIGSFLESNMQNFNPTERGIAYGSIFENFLNKNVYFPKDYISTLIQFLSTEKNSLLQQMLLSQFKEVYWFNLDEEMRLNLSAQHLNHFKQLMKIADSKPQKTFYFKVLSQFQHKRSEFSFFTPYLKGTSKDISLNEREKVHLYHHLRLEGLHDVQLYQTIKSNLKSEYYSELFDYLLPTTSQDTIQLQKYIKDITKVENRENETWVEYGLYYVNHPLQAEKTLDLIKPTIELIIEIQRTGDIFFPYNYLRNSIGMRTEKEVRETVNRYTFSFHTFKHEIPLDDKLYDKIQQNLDPVERRSN
ncbi:hypothetical protein KMW28_26060 [Flammeovirga yaeyamensis]|uniref:Aminopeptidase N n=1 Tax=Flammeovirga yaeyamensis TaxID=367791 RepID=A0AAX1NA81_9BACT|nr:M1 family aminopeptidase [Flammeovirga yaeyamensis]MBB3699234.1 aminopeptidase N [Flammeovirga yaeyamensis]NMF35503.1 peptidase M1 [Flammeovirga yaeyamensis]QWG04362.1 hypothetical protein KMW28_26060 [Flammeovirga yaeyamensis]